MADLVGPPRSSDSWSTTEVRSMSHSHVWTIRGFSQCDVRYLETSVKIRDATAPPPSVNLIENSSLLNFRIRLHPQGNKESNKDFSFFQVFCSQNQVKYRAKFVVYNSRNEEIPTTVYTGTQQLHGYFEYIRRDLLVSHIQPQDELQLVLKLTVTFDTVTKSSQTARPVGIPEPRPQEVTRDLEASFKDGRLTDFTIVIGDKEIPVHKVVLASRSPVFLAMMAEHTDEAQSGRVVLKDIDYEVMMDVCTFIYSGRAPNLQTMALDLLAAADRFALPGLKDMSDQVLRNDLNVDTVCKYLVFSDIYNARELKLESIKFIAANSTSVIHTEGWAEMVKQQPTLVTEVVSAISSEQKNGTPPLPSTQSFSGTEPSAKRSRLAGSSDFLVSELAPDPELSPEV